MRLAALYNVFNGLELLDKSIQQIENLVDEIVICYQTVSYKGEHKPDVESFVDKYRGRAKFHVIKFEPDTSLFTKENERRKLQLRINFAKQLRCTHFIGMAEDHFYERHEFAQAKHLTEKHDYDVTFTSMYTYFKEPTWQLTPIEDYYAPFISKLYPDTLVAKKHMYPLRVDPSVQLSTCGKWHLWEKDVIMLHHFSMVRSDIEHKFRNAAASVRWPAGRVEKFIEEYNNYNLAENPGVSYFQGRKIKVVNNYFGL